MKVGTDGVLLGSFAPVTECSRILDVGTGTGLIALMLAQRSEAQIDAVEIDRDACDCATGNVTHSPWPGRVHIYNDSFQHFAGDIHAPLYDLVVSNPPWFNNSLKSFDEKKNFARHTDSLPGNELLKGVVNVLKPGGKFAVILPYVEAQLFLVDAALFHLYCIRKLNVKPSAHKPCGRVLMIFSFQRTPPEEEDLVIHGNYGEYSEAYKSLTKDFYLAF